ncbi:MAG: hypothetical protein ACYS6W_08870 [Planctomycetota bacterium]
MEPQNYLGIYLSKGAATVVCLGSQGRGGNVLGCFSVSVEEQEEQNQQMLANLIARGCAERELKFSEVAVALDCAMFMQHNVHSEFNEPKQIAATIRFDTEEALATDVTNVAIAFEITSSDQTGSALTVFTAQRKILSDVILSLQQYNIDPVNIGPDVSCLSRFIRQNVSLPEDLHPFFCALSRRNGYFVIPAGDKQGAQKASAVRSFLIGPTQTRTELLAREVSVTAALVETGEAINCLKVFDSTGSVNYQQLGERLGIEAGGVDWLQSAGVEQQALTDCADTVDFAIAYGAALAHLEKAQSINFRSDFMPYQGKKLRLQKALKLAAVSVTILALAVGVYLQSQLWKINKDRNKLFKRLEADYSEVMFGKTPPAKFSSAKSKLATELRRIQKESGPLDKESVSARLTLVLEAFNKCAAPTRLNIDSVSITTKITIVGDTSSRGNTRRLFNAIKEKMEILKERVYSKDRRDHFSITVVPK